MEPKHPRLPLDALDNLWLQVGGTMCNLRCAHCYLSCSPTNRLFEPMTRDHVKGFLEESEGLGVKEYYMTGGEPFMNPHILDILDMTLSYGPATVLTNATLISPDHVERMARMEAASIYSLEIRISLEGYTAQMNDALRGRGAFEKAMKGVNLLVQQGFLPIITITRTWDKDDGKILKGFQDMLKAGGYDRPRLKVLPSLKMGRELTRDRGYTKHEWVTKEMMEEYDISQLVCSSTRVATNRGVYVCPILLEDDDACMGESLKHAMGEVELRHQACFTCYSYGAICSNISLPGRHA
ncbi:MAG: radical SAM protein [Deltaproteobacteria bacterium]|nr:radical SAM protein [Deltaproteobacteria bacterium]